jgi:hypothetical protein
METGAKLPLKLSSPFLLSAELAQAGFLPILPSSQRDGGPVKHGGLVVVSL